MTRDCSGCGRLPEIRVAWRNLEDSLPSHWSQILDPTLVWMNEESGQEG